MKSLLILTFVTLLSIGTDCKPQNLAALGPDEYVSSPEPETTTRDVSHVWQDIWASGKKPENWPRDKFGKTN